MSNEAKLVHVSDLHFSVNEHCQANYLAHSMPHLEDMTAKINSLNFDRLVISGDISNQGDMGSLELARDWIFGEIPISDDSSVGLKLEPAQVIPVPGNHDAYNNLIERSIFLRNLRQESIGNYNTVFEYHNFDPVQNYCRYDWIDKGDWGIWAVSVDTCYIGEEDVKGIIGHTPFEFIAKGKLLKRQAKQLLEWYDLGIRGELIEPHNNTRICKQKFVRSLKVAVMHHYLLEPDGHWSNYTLRVSDRKRVVRDLAMIDFDIVLCGHKHHSFAVEDNYGAYFDKRGQKRYVFNYLRRLLGVDTLPMQFCYKGERISKYVTTLIEWLYKREKELNYGKVKMDHINGIIDILDTSIKNPKQLEKEIEAYLQASPIQDSEPVDQDEICTLQEKVYHLTREKKVELRLKAQIISKFINHLGRRLFVQSMAGSATKASTTNKPRSFDVIKINKSSECYNVDIKRYRWNNETDSFDSPEGKHGLDLGHSRVMIY